MFKELFSFKGRIGRHTLLVTGTLSLFFVFILTGLMQILNIFGIVVTAILDIVAAWITLAGYTKRLHDRNKSGWWLLISLVPVIGWIWTFIECNLLSGTTVENRFGPPEFFRGDSPQTPFSQDVTTADSPLHAAATIKENKKVNKRDYYFYGLFCVICVLLFYLHLYMWKALPVLESLYASHDMTISPTNILLIHVIYFIKNHTMLIILPAVFITWVLRKNGIIKRELLQKTVRISVYTFGIVIPLFIIYLLTEVLVHLVISIPFFLAK